MPSFALKTPAALLLRLAACTSVRVKLAVAFAVVLCCMAVGSALSISQLSLLARHSADAPGAQGLYAEGRNLIIGLTLLGMGFAALLAWLIGRAITQPLLRAVALAEAVADGDLSRQPNPAGASIFMPRDELMQLDTALVGMVARLRDLVGTVGAGAKSVGKASVQIAIDSNSLRTRSDRAASHVHATASSMEQITQSVSRSSDAAHQAHLLAGQALEAATGGGVVMGQVVQTMALFSASSRQISDIASVMDLGCRPLTRVTRPTEVRLGQPSHRSGPGHKPKFPLALATIRPSAPRPVCSADCVDLSVTPRAFKLTSCRGRDRSSRPVAQRGGQEG